MFRTWRLSFAGRVGRADLEAAMRFRGGGVVLLLRGFLWLGLLVGWTWYGLFI